MTCRRISSNLLSVGRTGERKLATGVRHYRYLDRSSISFDKAQRHKSGRIGGHAPHPIAVLELDAKHEDAPKTHVSLARERSR